MSDYTTNLAPDNRTRRESHTKTENDLPTSGSRGSVIDTPPVAPKRLENTGFSELLTSVSQVYQKCLIGVSEVSRMSDVGTTIGDYMLRQIETCADLTGNEHIPLSSFLYREAMPRLIRRMKSTHLGALKADDNQLEELFGFFFDALKSNAVKCGIRTDEGLQYPEAAFLRFSELWEKAMYAERDWVYQLRMLIAKRTDYVRGHSADYPTELVQVEDDLLKQNVRLQATEAAMVLLCWEMSRDNPDGTFFLAQRDAARICCEVSGKVLDNDSHAQIIGRAGLARLQRLGLIVQTAKGTSYANGGRKNAKATSFRWVVGQDLAAVQPVVEASVDQTQPTASAADCQKTTEPQQPVVGCDGADTVLSDPKPRKQNHKIPPHLQTDEFLAAWESWVACRRKQSLSVSDTVLQRQLSILAIGDAQQAASIVSKGEENGWKGIPNNVWIPTSYSGLWCDRLPPHATPELKAKILAAIPKTDANGQRVVQPVKVDRSAWGSRTDPEFEKMSPEEQRRFILRRK